MKKALLLLLTLLGLQSADAQVNDYNPAIQPTKHLQYFKPTEAHLFAGDCMPFDYNGKFYLYWLLDQAHHAGLNGLGGHQWALSTSDDMINWKHYPVAIGIDHQWEKSICTGSMIAVDDAIYAYYSTRVIDDSGVHEQLSYAISRDGGMSFEKQLPNPFFQTPAKYESRNFRDPKIIHGEDGLYHLFISSYKCEVVLGGFGGCLVHLISTDLKSWSEVEPVLEGQVEVPECSDYFYWKGWYYLIYSTGGDTYYVRSKKPYGPWEYPTSQPMIEGWANVYKTAPLKDGRRVAVAFIPWRGGQKDHGDRNFGGNVLFRELYQGKDGMLYTRFMEQVLPEAITMKNLKIVNSTEDHTSIIKDNSFTLEAPNGTESAFMAKLPEKYRLQLTIDPQSSYDELGMFIRASDKHNRGYKLELNSVKKMVQIHNRRIEGVAGLDKKLTLDIIVCEDIIDVCIGDQRCIINRLPEAKGKDLFFYIKNGTAKFQELKLQELK